MSERILITGGAGFIGSRLALAHAADGDEVHVIVRPRGRSTRTPPRAVVHPIPLNDRDAVADCLAAARPSIIYHLAGDTGRNRGVPRPADRGRLTEDLENLLTLLAAAADAPSPVDVLVRAGSLAEYGDGPMPSREGQREQPLAAYTAAMVAGAHYSRMLQPRLPFPVLTARFALTYGPGQSEDFLLPWLVRRCLAGEPSTIGHPDWRRDMIFVDDLVEGLRELADARPPGGAIVNLATGTAPTVREIAGSILSATGANPSLITFGCEEDRGGVAHALWGCPDLARQLFGWSAKTPLAAGVQRTVEHMRQRMAA